MRNRYSRCCSIYNSGYKSHCKHALKATLVFALLVNVIIACTPEADSVQGNENNPEVTDKAPVVQYNEGSKPAYREDENNEPLVTHYICDEGKQFSVYYNEYRIDDQTFSLSQYEVMLIDKQTQLTSKLIREQSASGTTYSGTNLVFWSHGAEATLLQEDKHLYENCIVKP